MRRTLSLLLVSAVLFACSGCISGAILAGGTRHSYLNQPKTTVERVRKSLGEPCWSAVYSPMLEIRSTPEYQACAASQGQPPFIWGVEDTAERELTARCEVYRVKGPLADVLRAEHYGMALGCTFLLAEVLDPFLIPQAIRWRRERANDDSYLTYWFDEDDHYVACFRDDIRCPDGCR